MADTALTDADFKPWGAFPEVVEAVRLDMRGAKRVLDVGAGANPFPYATHTVDVVPRKHANIESVCVNFRQDRLPFDDNSFDYVYCRHTIEDLDDATHLLSEISRVGKRGYIETPSPLSELCRGIDGGSPPWRGYWHHRSFVWQEGQDLMLLAKIPRVEFLTFNDELIVQTLRQTPTLSNTYYFWEDRVSFKHAWDDFHMKHETQQPHTPYDQMVIGAAVAGHATSAAAILKMGEILAAHRAPA